MKPEPRRLLQRTMVRCGAARLLLLDAPVGHALDDDDRMAGAALLLRKPLRYRATDADICENESHQPTRWERLLGHTSISLRWAARPLERRLDVGKGNAHRLDTETGGFADDGIVLVPKRGVGAVGPRRRGAGT